MTTHDLKTWPDFFDAIDLGDKTFELRKNDRGFAVGDFLRLKEWLPGEKRYTGREINVRVNYMVTGCFGLEPGHSCLAIEKLIFFREPKKKNGAEICKAILG